MSLLGYVIAGFIFLSVLEAKITESLCGCKITEQLQVNVCKGTATVLQHKPITDKVDNVKFIHDSRTGYRCDLAVKIRSSLPIRLNNVGENDTGIYRFRKSGSNTNGMEIYCIELKINCEILKVTSGSTVNLTCKVENLKSVTGWKVPGGYNQSISTTRILTLRQVKKSHSGNYTCLGRKNVTEVSGGTPRGYYKYVLKVEEPQLIGTTKETSQEKNTSLYPLPTVVGASTTEETASQEKSSSQLPLFTVVVPASMTRKEKTPRSTTHMVTIKEKATERGPNFTKLKTTEPQDPTSMTEKAGPLTEQDSAVVYRVKGENATKPNSTGTRVTSALSVLVLSQLYMWTWKTWNYYF